MLRTMLQTFQTLKQAPGGGFTLPLHPPRRSGTQACQLSLNSCACKIYSTRTYALMCKLGINSHSQIYSYSVGVVYDCSFKMCNCRHPPKPSTSMPAAMLKVMSRTTIEGGPRGGGRLFLMRKLGIFRGMPTYELLLLSCA